MQSAAVESSGEDVCLLVPASMQCSARRISFRQAESPPVSQDLSQGTPLTDPGKFLWFRVEAQAQARPDNVRFLSLWEECAATWYW